MFSFRLWGDNLAIDLGTTNTLVYTKGKGVVLNIPSVMAIGRKDGKILAIGKEAKEMVGKTPENILAVRPMQDGVIADFDIAQKMMRYFIDQVQPRRLLMGPKLINGIRINEASHNLVENNVISGSNGNGVYICCAQEGANAIRGNYIGTDAAGKSAIMGNYLNGVTIERSGSNVIGPDNVIAYNDGHGVGIFPWGSLCNTITQNSIHNNGEKGIDVRTEDKKEPRTPFLIDFDIVAGTAAGTTCPNCTVELFSASDDQGRVYEGQVTADRSGAFIFNKGNPFTGPHLTATATDADGNTSESSVPTWGTRKLVILQQGNNLTRTRLETKRSDELEDNRIAGQWSGLWQMGPADYDRYLNSEILDVGFKQARLAINYLDPGPKIEWDKPEFTIDPGHEYFISGIASNDITVTYILTFWGKANHPHGSGLMYPRFKTEGEIQGYLNFVRFIVRYFKDRVQYFEIFNEPDNQMEVDDYLERVKRTVPVIRQGYPEAKIVVGGTSKLSRARSQDFLFAILNSDIMSLIEVFEEKDSYKLTLQKALEYAENNSSFVIAKKFIQLFNQLKL